MFLPAVNAAGNQGWDMVCVATNIKEQAEARGNKVGVGGHVQYYSYHSSSSDHEVYIQSNKCYAVMLESLMPEWVTLKHVATEVLLCLEALL